MDYSTELKAAKMGLLIKFHPLAASSHVKTTLVLTGFVLISALYGCKIMPSNMRTSGNEDEATNLIDQDSIQFVRSSNGSAGDLTFRLLDKHSCRIEYWADDPTGQPSPQSPMSKDCPPDNENLTVKISVANITAGIPLSFRIYVWPKALAFTSNVSVVWKESKDLTKIQAGYLVVARYMNPRQASEIHTYQFPQVISIDEVKKTLKTGLATTSPLCSEGDSEPEMPYPRYKSLTDKNNRPMHGLSQVFSDGFARAAAVPHPFFNTRLTQAFEGIDKQQGWKWGFTWEGQNHTFESYAPGYMNAVTYLANDSSVPVSGTALGTAMSVLDAGSRPFVIKANPILNSEIANFRMTIKSSDASRTLIRCNYPTSTSDLSIPTNYYDKIPAGEFIVTLILDSSQIHYKEGAPYPPWIISSQDWVHFKINKRL